MSWRIPGETRRSPFTFRARKIVRLHCSTFIRSPRGVIAIGDLATDVAAIVGERLGLRFHSLAAVRACRNKFLSRSALRAAGLPTPAFRRIPLAQAPDSDGVEFPCVLKPLGLSASRGVIRANDASEFRSAFGRIAAIVREERDSFIQIETYIPGAEFALEGLVIDGRLKTFALFDKPDPLDGPFFEETIYVTPSRQSGTVQSDIACDSSVGGSCAWADERSDPRRSARKRRGRLRS